MNQYCFVRLVCIVGLFISVSASAQQIELGGGLGTMLYKGDVSPSLNPRFALPAGNLFFRYNATRSFSTRIGVGFGAIRAEDRVSNDPFQKARDYAFRTTIGEVTLDAAYNFRDFRMIRWPRNLSPYVFGGLGFMAYKPRANKESRLIFPLGVGVKYEFKRPWSVGLEFGTRFTRNDDLDGLSYVATLNKLQQGNPGLKDQYTYTAITLSYTFYKITCPE